MILFNKKAAMSRFGDKIQQITTARESGSPRNDAKFSAKKAAMFGLDARIALAIFAALSVITGAALYNIMQEIQLTSLISEFEEIAQATEAYALDTGIDLPRHYNAAFSARTSDPGELLTSTKPGWKGPYVRRELDLADQRFKKSNGFGGHFHIYKNTTSRALCDSSDECYMWIRLDYVAPKMCDKFDLRVDGIADDNNGKVIIERADATTCLIFYKAYPALTHTYSY